jgi:hypothetical protein
MENQTLRVWVNAAVNQESTWNGIVAFVRKVTAKIPQAIQSRRLFW